MTRQEMFNIAYKGLASQGFEHSLDRDGFCVYRGENGRRCAIGWLIPDERYYVELEGRSVYNISIPCAVGCDVNDAVFLSSLQCCHDRARSPFEMKEALRVFATNYSLTIPEVESA